jgi:site-specific DNA-methyltransferase (adenine-specific)
MFMSETIADSAPETMSISDNSARLIHGDFLEVIKDIPADSVDLVLTDPPFKVISGGSGEDPKHRRPRGVLSKNDGKIFAHNSIKPSHYMPVLYRVLKPGRDAYVMTNNITLESLLVAADLAGFKTHGLLFWNKNTCTPSRWYMKNVELVLYLYKPPARPINHPNSKQTFEADNPRNKTHPTEKPVALMEHYVLNSTEPGWTVLDPFMGSGAVGVACKSTGRDFLGIEIDREYFDAATTRMINQEAESVA